MIFQNYLNKKIFINQNPYQFIQLVSLIDFNLLSENKIKTILKKARNLKSLFSKKQPKTITELF